MANSLSLADVSQGQAEIPEELQPFLGGILDEFVKLKLQVTQLREENRRLSDALALAGITIPSRGVTGGSASSGGLIKGAATGSSATSRGLVTGPDTRGSASGGGLITGDYSRPPNPSGPNLQGGTQPEAAPQGSGVFYRQEAVHNLGDDAPPQGGPPQPQVDLVTDEMLQYVAAKLDLSSWQPFVRTLGVPDSELEAIRHDNALAGVGEQKFRALLWWKENSDLHLAVTERLVTMLLRRKHRYLAEKFCEKFPGYEHLLKMKF